MATPLDTSVLVGRCAERFRELGLRVRQSSDFNEIEGLVDRLEKPYLTQQLSPNWQEFTEETAFWLIAEDHAGAPVASIGARMDQLGSEHIASYWFRQLKRIMGDGEKSPISSKHFPPVAYQMKGNIVYFGDLFVKPAIRGAPRFPLRAFSVMAYSLAMVQWKVDWFYAFFSDKHAKQGVPAQYLMNRAYPFVHYWEESRPLRTNSDWVMCMDHQDAAYMIETMSENPDFL